MAARQLLVECLLNTGDLTETEEQAMHVRQMRTAKLGLDHPYTIIISCDLARVLSTAGRSEEAQPLAAQVLGTDDAYTRRLRSKQNQGLKSARPTHPNVPARSS